MSDTPRFNDRANTTSYQHPQERNLLDLHTAMQYRADGSPEIRVNSTFEGNIVISGNVNIPGEVTVNSSPENPVHVHLTELGTYGNLATFMPVQGNVIVNSGNIVVYQGTTPWIVKGNVDVVGNISGITTLPSITGNVGVSGNIDITRMPTVTGNVHVYGNVSVDNFPSNIRITDMPGITGNVHIWGNISGSDQPITVNQGSTPWQISKNSTVNSSTNPIYVSNEGSTVVVGDLPAPSLTAFDEPLAIGITPVIQADAMYGLDPDFWVTSELRGGNIAVTTDTTWQVSSGTSAGGYARLATSKYMTYQPGQGSMFRWTAAFTTTGGNTKSAFGIDNIVQNTGPVDREDGYSFGFSGSTANDASRRIGILHRRAGKAETRALTITTAPTGTQTATVTLDGVAYTVPLTASTSTAYTANQIAKELKLLTTANNTWDIEGCNGVITFTYYSPGPKGGVYSFSSTGTGTLAAGTFSQLAVGVTPSDTWTYVDSWDNQTIQFDPTKLNVFGVDFRWLGAGRVRFFMEDPATGKMVLVHTQRWASQYTVPHLAKPSMRIIYRSGTTNPAITPSQNVIVTGASVFAGIQGMINQTGGSQGWYNIDSTTRAKDLVWHLLSLQNPYVRGNGVNKASIILQDLTVAAQGNDPSVLYIVKNAIGTSDLLVYQTIPNTTFSMFAQYSVSAVTEDLALDRITNIQTLGINSSATFRLQDYNLSLAPGETVSVFISSSNAINRTATGMTWKVD